MLGGEWFESLFGEPGKVSEESIKGVALAELKNQLGVTKKPIRSFSKIHKVSLIEGAVNNQLYLMLGVMICNSAIILLLLFILELLPFI